MTISVANLSKRLSILQLEQYEILIWHNEMWPPRQNYLSAYVLLLTFFSRQEFSKTKEALASENMVLTKKLDALEEFRIQREQLMAKFEEQVNQKH